MAETFLHGWLPYCQLILCPKSQYLHTEKYQKREIWAVCDGYICILINI